MRKEYGFKFSIFPLIFLLLMAVAKQATASDWLYTMRPGDTIWTLCQQYTKEPNCWQKLGPLNNIDRDRAIAPGTRIRIPANWLKVPAASAIISYVQGEVIHQRADGSKATASKGGKLTIGSALVTNDGSASIEFADGSSLVLESNSHLELDSLSSFELNGMVDSTLRLNRGTIKTRVIKREPKSLFRTITPSAIAAVRGTEYRVSVSPEINANQAADNQTPSAQTVKTEHEVTAKQTTRVEVYTGLVDVGAEKVTYPVPAAFGLLAKQGEPPQAPVKLLNAPVFDAFKTQQTRAFDTLSKAIAAINIRWQALPNASGYQLNVLAAHTLQNEQDNSQGSAGESAQKSEQLIKSYRSSDNELNLNELPVGCYQLSLRAIDTLGLHGMAANKRLCLNQQIATPLLAIVPLQQSDKPIDDKQPDSEQTIKLNWDKVSDATNYRIQVASDADFGNIVSSIETSALTHVVAQQSTPLFVRVQALGALGNHSNFSQTTTVQPKEIKEEKSYWSALLPIGLFLLALL